LEVEEVDEEVGSFWLSVLSKIVKGMRDDKGPSLLQ
jgi:hypothetical protein